MKACYRKVVLFVIPSFLVLGGDTFGQIKIMPLGDSITRGEIVGANPPYSGYRDDLYTKLVNAGISFNFVGSLSEGNPPDPQHEGHGGFKSSAIDANLNTYLNPYPDLGMVLLHIGTNDLSSGLIPPSEVKTNIASIVDKINQNNNSTKIFLSSNIPRTDGKNDKTIELNGLIQQLVEEKFNAGYNIEYVGQYEIFTNTPNWETTLMSNSLHPNDAGYALMADVWFNSITTALGDNPEVTDNFNRFNIGSTWVTGPEFDIINGELSNTSTDESWAHMAVYIENTNPTSISFKWGTGADANGIMNGGLALRLDAPSNTANGYLLWYNGNKISLWTIVSGAPGQGITSVTATLPAPQANDTVKVKLGSNATSNFFDVYINGQFDGRISDTNKLQGNATTLYAGFMLHGNRNNNVDDFTFVKILDNTPPATVTDLNIISTTSSTMTLKWTAPGDDSTSGTASSYDIRYSTAEINANNFSSATPITDAPDPLPAGTLQTMTITNLGPGIQYYFAMKTKDDVGNFSNLSNVVTDTTIEGAIFVDNFNRLNLGSSWVADSEVMIVNDELANTSSLESWGFMAVLKERKNPFEVEFKWGLNATQDGIDRAGFALMLDNLSTTANGYLFWRHPLNNKIDLWTIVNGAPGAGIANVVGNLPAPKAGDIMKVIIRQDASGNHFDLFINNQYDGTLTDPDSLQGTASTLYAGVLLHGNRANNIDDFTVVTPLGQPSTLEAVAGDGQTGIVGTQLPDTLTVELTDEFGNPISNKIVDFEIIEGNGTINDLISNGTNIRIDAEAGDLTAPMQIASDPQASNGKYIWVPVGETNNNGEASYNFQISQDGTYVIWGRTIAPSGLEDSFFITVDNGADLLWDVEHSETWIWDKVSDRNNADPVLFQFSAGTHTLKVKRRDRGTKLDKLLITKDLNYVPTGLENVTNVTNNDGRAFASLTLGTTVGTNKVQASTPEFPNIAPVTFTATAIVGAANTIVKVSGDGQTAPPGTQLPNPLVVKLTDQFGNLIGANYPILFQVITGNGTLTNPDTVFTDASSQAQNMLITSTDTSITKVQVTTRNYTGPDVIFIATAEPSDPEKIELIAGDNQTGSAGHPLPNPFQVVVTDMLGSRIFGVDVTFTVTGGGGNFSGNSQTTVATNAQGIAAATLTLGPTPGGTNTAQASASFNGNPLTGSPVTFTATSAVPQALEAISQLTQNGTASLPLGDSIKVKVRDALGQPLANYPVNFTVTLGDGKVNGSTNPVEVTTDANGVAKVEWRLGSNAGQSNNKLRATATYNSQALNGSPIDFTASAAVGTAANLIEVSGDSLSGQIDSPLSAPFVVKVTDNSDNTVPGWPVTFTVEAGGGKINGKTVETVPTNAEGLASATLTLGSTSGTPTNPYNNRVKVTAENNSAPLNGSPIFFVASAIASAARNLVLEGGANQSGPAGLALPKQIQVKVTDNQQNPIVGHPVTFKVKNGGGTLNGTVASDTVKQIPTNDNGIATVTWYLGGALGTNSQSLTVRADDGINDLNGSPMTVLASAVAGPVDPDVSFLLSDKAQLPADGQSKATITVTLSDKFGNPVAGKAVTIKSSGSNNFIIQPSDPTNANGQAIGTISSTKAETKLITARSILDGFDLNNSIPVEFIAIAADRIDLSSGNEQTANVGTALDNPIEVIVKDMNNNPVPGIDVKFTVPTSGGGGYIMNAASAPQGSLGKIAMITSTDSNGKARATWVLGPNPGNNRAEARVDGLTGSPVVFTATGVNATPASLTKYSGDNQDILIAGKELPERLAVKVTDANGKAVWNVPVYFTVQLGGGSFSNANVDTVLTDYLGIAQTIFTLGQTVGTNIVQVSTPSLSESVTFSFESVVGLPSILEAMEGDGGSGNVNSVYLISVRITDIYGNPVEGTHAGFQVIVGSATFQGPSNTTTNALGIAQAQVILPTTVGTVVIKATSSELPSFFKTFTITVLPGAAAVIAEFSGNNQEGTIGRELVSPLEVLVTDTYGNPVSGIAVQWVRTQGSGHLRDNSSMSDAQGVAKNYFTLSNQTGLNEAWAINSSLSGNPIIFTATGVTNKFPVFNILPNDTSVVEGDALIFKVHATDDDGDPVTYDAQNLPPGASFITDTFSWTPGLQQSGEYEVTITASDNHNGKDVETITITVTNRNNPPEITSYIPTELELVFVQGDTINFSVTATDADIEPLDYEWFISTDINNNGTLVSRFADFVFDTHEFAHGSYIIKVVVTDGQDTDSMSWNIDVVTSVELASFVAQFSGFDGVQISWITNREIDNRGFNILRSQSKNGTYMRVNDALIASSSKGQYQFFDKNVVVGRRYFYMLEDIDINGVKTQHGPITVAIAAPETFKLSQNYPNPFNPQTKIRYELPKADRVVIKIFDLLGREVKTLVDERKEAGFHVATWDGKDNNDRQVSSGIYYYQILSAEFKQTKKMLLIK